MKRALPVSLLSWCALLVVAAFLPWGTYSATPDFSVNGIHIPDQMLPFPIEMTLTGNAWRGSLTAWSVQIPNYVVFMAVIAIAAHALLRAYGLVPDRRTFSVLMAAYGIFHVGLLVMALLANDGIIGIGSILNLVGFSGVLVTVCRQPAVAPAADPPVAPPAPTL